MTDLPEAPGHISSALIHDGRIRLTLDRVRFPDGTEGELEMIRHPGAAAILPVLGDPADPDPEVVLVRQYRYATDGYIYEVPAGIPNSPDEPWETCAHRELEEETGYRAATLGHLTWIYTTPGFTDEVIHLFLATDLEPGARRLDEDEFLETVTLPFSRVLEMIRGGEIVDGKSIATLLYAAQFAIGVGRASG